METEVSELLNEVPRKVWTREESHLLVEMRFPNAEKLELVDGQLIDRRRKKRPHVICQALVHEWLISVFGPGRVESESPADVARDDNQHSEPEPDLKVLRKPLREYSANPQPEDILLVVEISDSTLRFDLETKANLYARAEIAEYWVVNVPGKKLIVHREPRGGQYANVVTYLSNERVCPLAAPNAPFSLERL